jgi:hypothetical protein
MDGALKGDVKMKAIILTDLKRRRGFFFDSCVIFGKEEDMALVAEIDPDPANWIETGLIRGNGMVKINADSGKELAEVLGTWRYLLDLEPRGVSINGIAQSECRDINDIAIRLEAI